MASLAAKFAALTGAQKAKVALASVSVVSLLTVAIALVIVFTHKEKSQRRELENGDTDVSVRQLSQAGGADSTDSALLSTYMPIYHLDYREKIMPVSLEQYVKDKKLVEDGSVTGTVTASPTAGNKYLHYFLYFPEDGGLFIGTKAVDAHRYDIEHLVVEVNVASGAVVGVLYQPHGGKEHYWLRDLADLARILAFDKRPSVYVSHGKHAGYPISGTIYRYGGFASDSIAKPVRQRYHVVPASAAVLKLKSIDGVFQGLPKRLDQDFAKKPNEKLDRARRRLLFTLPA
jgi:hypothetical protein